MHICKKRQQSPAELTQDKRHCELAHRALHNSYIQALLLRSLLFFSCNTQCIKAAPLEISMFEIMLTSGILIDARLKFNGEIARNTWEFQVADALFPMILNERANVSWVPPKEIRT